LPNYGSSILRTKTIGATKRCRTCSARPPLLGIRYKIIMKTKIEEGCLAIIIDGGGSKSNIGILVTVGKFIGKIPGFTGKNNWEIDKAILFTDNTYWDVIEEKFLKRIDEETNDQQIHQMQKTEPVN